MNQTIQASSSYVRRMSDVRSWARGLLKNCIHSATGTLLAAMGTNTIEGMSPNAIRPFVEGIGMNFQQAIAVFVVSLGMAALRYVNQSTAPGNTNAPWPSQ